MAKMRFALSTWNKGASINGKDAGTGFLVVELDNTVSIKTIFKTNSTNISVLCTLREISQ